MGIWAAVNKAVEDKAACRERHCCIRPELGHFCLLSSSAIILDACIYVARFTVCHKVCKKGQPENSFTSAETFLPAAPKNEVIVDRLWQQQKYWDKLAYT